MLRDDAYGFIGWHQEEQGRPRQDVELDNPDLVALAKAFGVRGQRVTEGHDLETALADPGVNLIDCPIDYDINEILEADLHQQAIEARPRH